jgi:hypothetical protein
LYDQKNNSLENMIMNEQGQQNIILCIPYRKTKALLHALLAHDTGYIYAGAIIKSLTSDYLLRLKNFK